MDTLVWSLSKYFMWSNTCSLAQILNDASSFRGSLKQAARSIVMMSYSNAFTTDLVCGYGQAEHEQEVQRNIEQLLRGSAYLHNGVDHQVRLQQDILFVSKSFTRDAPTTLPIPASKTYAFNGSTVQEPSLLPCFFQTCSKCLYQFILWPWWHPV